MIGVRIDFTDVGIGGDTIDRYLNGPGIGLQADGPPNRIGNEEIRGRVVAMPVSKRLHVDGRLRSAQQKNIVAVKAFGRRIDGADEIPTQAAQAGRAAKHVPEDAPVDIGGQRIVTRHGKRNPAGDGIIVSGTTEHVDKGPP